VITLITGGPGLGKTALAVSMLQKQYADRPIFTNINGLTLEHSLLPKLEEWTQEVENAQGTFEHHFTFPAGAIVVIDECQQFFRPRAAGSKVPPYISAFETHRHRGIDFILITQGSRLIDSNLRSLVKGGQHIFLKSSYLGRFRYEKSEVINEDDKTSYSLASKRKYTLPKESFSLYKSAELHTKPPRPRLPWAAYLIAIAVILGGLLAWRTSDRIHGFVAGEETSAKPHTTGPVAERPATGVQATQAALMPITEALTPTDPHNPLSAPLYAPVAPKPVPPEVQGCIASKSKCTCYSQQQTPVWMPEEQCRQRAAGEYYDPYRQPSAPQQAQAATSPVTAEPPKEKGAEAPLS